MYSIRVGWIFKRKGIVIRMFIVRQQSRATLSLNKLYEKASVPLKSSDIKSIYLSCREKIVTTKITKVLGTL
ncbi:hypothetical protein J2810_002336 [Chryseobacterium rhizosphaerae]|nr:hypothetical protein [Chryseobacterium rhizosphaerae]